MQGVLLKVTWKNEVSNFLKNILQEIDLASQNPSALKVKSNFRAPSSDAHF